MSGGHDAGSHGLAPAADPSLCEREPIHIPGAIQPHGAVLAAQADGLLVTHASANLAAILGRPAEAVLGRPLEEAVGAAACRALQGAGSRDGTALGRVHSVPGPHGGMLCLRAHPSGGRICIDIEPEAVEGPLVTMLQAVLETFKHAVTRGELCDLAVRGLKEISGYDRVMAYRFGEDGHGEVIAEACAAQLEPYLGLRYPAADVPPQARQQYLRQRVGAIADSSYRPVPLLADPALDDGSPLDLTHSALRSVSPVHCLYMRNMRTAASVTVGLAHGQHLWGMLVCHHATARIAGPELRAVADMIGQVVSLLLGSLGGAEASARRLERNGTLRALVDRLAAPLALPEALAAAETELLQLVDAAGAVVRLSGTLFCLGRTPPTLAVERAVAVLLAEAGGEVLALDDLGRRHPDLACCTSDGSGALLLPLAQGSDDAILWFRPELLRTISWGGNPTEHVISDPVTGLLSPRASFAAWKETVSGRSASWTAADLAIARELRSAVEATVAQRAKQELAELRYRHEQSLRIQDMRFQAALENMGDGLAMFDADERLVVCNSRYGSMYGLPAALQRVATPYRDIVSYRVKNGIMAGATSDLAVGEKIDALRLVPRDTASGRIEELSDGRLIRILRQPLEDGGWVGTHEDVTDRHRNDLKISFMANHDPLTGLANRTFFNEKIEYAVARLRRHGEVFAVLMLDLDRFKNVNDTLGHQAGDRLLQETAQRLRSSLRETDVVARLGGDEFAIIQAGEKSPREGAAKLAARMSQIVSRPHDIDGNIVSVGVSIGIALAPDHARESRDLLRMADLALYRAKAEGRNAFRFFDAAMATDSDNRRELEAGLRAAITRGEFVLHYQPIVDAKTRRPAAFEALIRWRHPTRGLIPPGDFIPLAEETGLIVRIGQWVLQQACADAAKWPAAINVAVNLSPVQLATPELLQVVRSALVESGLAPERLELEITETALFRHEVDYVALLRQLKKLGVSIALDDFGTGYSSLSSVTMFPVDRIKIDRSFIMNLTKRADCAAIVATVLALGRAIDARTVAEGVETEEQFAILRANGVDFAQGYLFGRPCQVSDIGFDDSDPLSPAKSAA